MKTKIFSALVLGAMVFAFSACDKKNEVTTDKQNEKNGHEYVDLGLPSGTLWATCNVGATKPELAGYFFAWGETEPKNQFFEENYKWPNFEKYNEKDGKTQLDPEDDAATKNWGEPWRMPTREEVLELMANCTVKTIDNKYCLITSNTNGNSIKLAIAGYRVESINESGNAMGAVWASSIDSFMGIDFAIVLGAGNVGNREAHFMIRVDDYGMRRNFGINVRPVCKLN